MLNAETKNDYPAHKITIIGGGIIGALEAYYAYLDAKKSNNKISRAVDFINNLSSIILFNKESNNKFALIFFINDLVSNF